MRHIVLKSRPVAQLQGDEDALTTEQVYSLTPEEKHYFEHPYDEKVEEEKDKLPGISPRGTHHSYAAKASSGKPANADRIHNETITRLLNAQLKLEKYSSCPDLSPRIILGDRSPNLSIAKRKQYKRVLVPSAPTTPQTTPTIARRRFLTGSNHSGDQSPVLSRSLSSNVGVRLRKHLNDSERLILSYPGAAFAQCVAPKQSNQISAVESESRIVKNPPGKDAQNNNMLTKRDIHGPRKNQSHNKQDCDRNQGKCVDETLILHGDEPVNHDEYEDYAEEISPDVLEKCTTWLDGVKAARGEKCLDDVTRAPVIWT